MARGRPRKEITKDKFFTIRTDHQTKEFFKKNKLSASKIFNKSVSNLKQLPPIKLKPYQIKKISKKKEGKK